MDHLVAPINFHGRFSSLLFHKYRPLHVPSSSESEVVEEQEGSEKNQARPEIRLRAPVLFLCETFVHGEWVHVLLVEFPFFVWFLVRGDGMGLEVCIVRLCGEVMLEGMFDVFCEEITHSCECWPVIGVRGAFFGEACVCER